jgi:hypothetical protein
VLENATSCLPAPLTFVYLKMQFNLVRLSRVDDSRERDYLG